MLVDWRTLRWLLVVVVAAGCPGRASIHAANGAHQADESQRAKVIGHWYGDNPIREGGKQLELTDLTENGTYTTQYRIIERSGSVRTGTEAGLWGVSGSIYFTITQAYVHGEIASPADPTSASVYNAYEVTQLDDKTFRYRCATCAGEWTLRRVPESFTLPESTEPSGPPPGTRCN